MSNVFIEYLGEKYEHEPTPTNRLASGNVEVPTVLHPTPRPVGKGEIIDLSRRWEVVLLAFCLFVAALFALPVIAATDYTCASNCQARGMSYGYCQSACSYEPVQLQPQAYQPTRQTDYTCMNRCTSQGNQYAYCHQACSY
jgi:hypothetical protein